jgi:enhancing lycopene biosynthesis protein 2
MFGIRFRSLLNTRGIKQGVIIMNCAIILSGCGQHDGSETHEVILTLLSLDQEGIIWRAFAPDIEQPYVVNHVTDIRHASESRSVLQESARLVRGRIASLSTLQVDEFDAIIFPGGFGAVVTLCDWLQKKSAFHFIPEVERVVLEARAKKKPMGFICIAPVMIPKIYPTATLTIGHDADISALIESMGCQHIECAADDIVVDHTHKVVSTPANMVADNISDVYIGIRKLVRALKQMK